MSLKKVLPFALMAMLSVSTACGGDDDDDDDDPTGPTGDAPSAQEAADIFEALSVAFSLAFAGPGNGLAGQTVTYNHQGSCPGGGTTSVAGNYTVVSSNQNGGTFNYTVTQTFNNCVSDGGGTSYTFNGQGLTLEADYSYTQTPLSYEYEFHETGNISWSGGGKSGTCAINITASLEYSQSGVQNYTYSGTICGVSVS